MRVLDRRPVCLLEAVAEALAEGMDSEAVGEAISLAANLLVLHDPGRREQNSSPEKPAGCVHGDSIGVHASARPAFRWRQLIALACVTASQHGFPAPGYEESRQQLGLS